MIRADLIKERKAISPVIATLLLILIAIAAGVVLYAYVIGFIANSTSNSGATTSVIQIANFCASTTTHCSGADEYYLSVLNAGTVTIPSSTTIELYFTDVTAGTSGTATCNDGGSISPGSSYTCSAASWTGIISPSAGDTITVKVVNPDGGAATSSTKVIG